MAISEFDQYGIAANFEFGFKGNSLQNIRKLEQQLDNLNHLVIQLQDSSKKMNGSVGLIGQVKDIQALQKGFGHLSDEVAATRKEVVKLEQTFAESGKQKANQYKKLHSIIRSIRKEADNIDFDTKKNGVFNILTRSPQQGSEGNAFKKRIAQLKHYQKELGNVDISLDRTIAKERQYSAQIKREQKLLQTRIELIREQDTALRASRRIGEFSGLRDIGKLGIEAFKRINALEPVTEFSEAMSNVEALSKASGDALKQLRNEAKRLGGTTRYTATQVAGAEGFLAMAGFDPKEITDSLKSMLDLSTGGRLGLERSADIVSNAMGSFQKEAVMAQQAGVNFATIVADVFANTATSTNTSVEQMAEAFNYGASTAAQAGLTIAETSALIGASANIGIQGSSAGTGLRAGILNLLTPQKATALQKLGVQTLDATGKLRNVVDVISDIQRVTNLDRQAISPEFSKQLMQLQEGIDSGEITDASKAINDLSSQYDLSGDMLSKLSSIFGKTALPFWLAQISQGSDVAQIALANLGAQVDQNALSQVLFNKTFSDSADIYKQLLTEAGSYSKATELLQAGIDQLTQANSRGEGAAARMAIVMENNLKGSFTSLGSAIESLYINYLEPIVPVIKAVVDGFTNLIRFVANLPAPIRFLGGSMALLLVTGAALAVTIGTVGVALFGFVRATAMANVATISLSRNLGHMPEAFMMGVAAMQATNPLETFITSSTKLVDDFRTEIANNFTATGTQIRRTVLSFARGTNQIMMGIPAMLQSVLLSPAGLLILQLGAIAGAVVLIDKLLMQTGVNFGIIDTIVKGLITPIAFVLGMFKGIGRALGEFSQRFKTTFAITRQFDSLFKTIGDRVKLFFDQVNKQGEDFGYNLTKMLLSPFDRALTLWQKTWYRFNNYLISQFKYVVDRISLLWYNLTQEGIVGGIRHIISDLKALGMKFVSILAENSPGPTALIREKWAYTFTHFLPQTLKKFLSFAAVLGASLFAVFSPESISYGFERALDTLKIASNAIFTYVKQPFIELYEFMTGQEVARPSNLSTGTEDFLSGMQQLESYDNLVGKEISQQIQLDAQLDDGALAKNQQGFAHQIRQMLYAGVKAAFLDLPGMKTVVAFFQELATTMGQSYQKIRQWLVPVDQELTNLAQVFVYLNRVLSPVGDFTGAITGQFLDNLDAMGIALLSFSYLPKQLLSNVLPSALVGELAVLAPFTTGIYGAIVEGLPLIAGTAIYQGFSRSISDALYRSLVDMSGSFDQMRLYLLDFFSFNFLIGISPQLSKFLTNLPFISTIKEALATTASFRQLGTALQPLGNAILHVGQELNRMGDALVNAFRPFLEGKQDLALMAFYSYQVVKNLYGLALGSMLENPAFEGTFYRIGYAIYQLIYRALAGSFSTIISLPIQLLLQGINFNKIFTSLQTSPFLQSLGKVLKNILDLAILRIPALMTRLNWAPVNVAGQFVAGKIASAIEPDTLLAKLSGANLQNLIMQFLYQLKNGIIMGVKTQSGRILIGLENLFLQGVERIATIPHIGVYLSEGLMVAYQQMKVFAPQMLNLLKIMSTELVALVKLMGRELTTLVKGPAVTGFLSVLGEVFSSLGLLGITFVQKGFKPLMTLFSTLLKPFPMMRAFQYFIKSDGFRGIFAIGTLTPFHFLYNFFTHIDGVVENIANLLTGGRLKTILKGKGLFDRSKEFGRGGAAVTLFRQFTGKQLPTDIINRDMGQALKLMFADRQAVIAKARDLRILQQAAGVGLGDTKGLMMRSAVMLNDILNQSNGIATATARILVFGQALPALIQGVLGITATLHLWYALIKAINPELLYNIRNIKFLGIDLTLLSQSLLVARSAYIGLIDFVDWAIPASLKFSYQVIKATNAIINFTAELVGGLIRGLGRAIDVVLIGIKNLVNGILLLGKIILLPLISVKLLGQGLNSVIKAINYLSLVSFRPVDINNALKGISILLGIQKLLNNMQRLVGYILNDLITIPRTFLKMFQGMGEAIRLADGRKFVSSLLEGLSTILGILPKLILSFTNLGFLLPIYLFNPEFYHRPLRELLKRIFLFTDRGFEEYLQKSLPDQIKSLLKRLAIGAGVAIAAMISPIIAVVTGVLGIIAGGIYALVKGVYALIKGLIYTATHVREVAGMIRQAIGNVVDDIRSAGVQVISFFSGSWIQSLLNLLDNLEFTTNIFIAKFLAPVSQFLVRLDKFLKGFQAQTWSVQGLFNFIANMLEVIIKAVPFVALGLLGLGFILTGSIGGAFAQVGKGFKGFFQFFDLIGQNIQGLIVQVGRLTKAFMSMFYSLPGGKYVEAAIGGAGDTLKRQFLNPYREAMNDFRSQETIMGVRNPFVYSENEAMRQRAKAGMEQFMANEQVYIDSSVAFKAFKQMQKSVIQGYKQQLIRGRTEDVAKLTQTRKARINNNLVDLEPIMRKQGMFGLERNVLTQAGRLEATREAINRLLDRRNEEETRGILESMGVETRFARDREGNIIKDALGQPLELSWEQVQNKMIQALKPFVAEDILSQAASNLGKESTNLVTDIRDVFNNLNKINTKTLYVNGEKMGGGEQIVAQATAAQVETFMQRIEGLTLPGEKREDLVYGMMGMMAKGKEVKTNDRALQSFVQAVTNPGQIIDDVFARAFKLIQREGLEGFYSKPDRIQGLIQESLGQKLGGKGNLNRILGGKIKGLDAALQPKELITNLFAGIQGNLAATIEEIAKGENTDAAQLYLQGINKATQERKIVAIEDIKALQEQTKLLRSQGFTSVTPLVRDASEQTSLPMLWNFATGEEYRSTVANFLDQLEATRKVSFSGDTDIDRFTAEYIARITEGFESAARNADFGEVDKEIKQGFLPVLTQGLKRTFFWTRQAGADNRKDLERRLGIEQKLTQASTQQYNKIQALQEQDVRNRLEGEKLTALRRVKLERLLATQEGTVGDVNMDVLLSWIAGNKGLVEIQPNILRTVNKALNLGIENSQKVFGQVAQMTEGGKVNYVPLEKALSETIQINKQEIAVADIAKGGVGAILSQLAQKDPQLKASLNRALTYGIAANERDTDVNKLSFAKGKELGEFVASILNQINDILAGQGMALDIANQENNIVALTESRSGARELGIKIQDFIAQINRTSGAFIGGIKQQEDALVSILGDIGTGEHAAADAANVLETFVKGAIAGKEQQRISNLQDLSRRLGIKVGELKNLEKMGGSIGQSIEKFGLIAGVQYYIEDTLKLMEITGERSKDALSDNLTKLNEGLWQVPAAVDSFMVGAWRYLTRDFIAGNFSPANLIPRMGERQVELADRLGQVNQGINQGLDIAYNETVGALIGGLGQIPGIISHKFQGSKLGQGINKYLADQQAGVFTPQKMGEALLNNPALRKQRLGNIDRFMVAIEKEATQAGIGELDVNRILYALTTRRGKGQSLAEFIASPQFQKRMGIDEQGATKLQEQLAETLIGVGGFDLKEVETLLQQQNLVLTPEQLLPDRGAQLQGVVKKYLAIGGLIVNGLQGALGVVVNVLGSSSKFLLKDLLAEFLPTNIRSMLATGLGQAGTMLGTLIQGYSNTVVGYFSKVPILGRLVLPLTRQQFATQLTEKLQQWFGGMGNALTESVERELAGEKQGFFLPRLLAFFKPLQTLGKLLKRQGGGPDDDNIDPPSMRNSLQRAMAVFQALGGNFTRLNEFSRDFIDITGADPIRSITELRRIGLSVANIWRKRIDQLPQLLGLVGESLINLTNNQGIRESLVNWFAGPLEQLSSARETSNIEPLGQQLLQSLGNLKDAFINQVDEAQAMIQRDGWGKMLWGMTKRFMIGASKFMGMFFGMRKGRAGKAASLMQGLIRFVKGKDESIQPGINQNVGQNVAAVQLLDDSQFRQAGMELARGRSESAETVLGAYQAFFAQIPEVIASDLATILGQLDSLKLKQVDAQGNTIDTLKLILETASQKVQGNLLASLTGIETAATPKQAFTAMLAELETTFSYKPKASKEANIAAKVERLTQLEQQQAQLTETIAQTSQGNISAYLEQMQSLSDRFSDTSDILDLIESDYELEGQLGGFAHALTDFQEQVADLTTDLMGAFQAGRDIKPRDLMNLVNDLKYQVDAVTYQLEDYGVDALDLLGDSLHEFFAPFYQLEGDIQNLINSADIEQLQKQLHDTQRRMGIYRSQIEQLQSDRSGLVGFLGQIVEELEQTGKLGGLTKSDFLQILQNEQEQVVNLKGMIMGLQSNQAQTNKLWEEFSHFVTLADQIQLESTTDAVDFLRQAIGEQQIAFDEQLMGQIKANVLAAESSQRGRELGTALSQAIAAMADIPETARQQMEQILGGAGANIIAEAGLTNQLNEFYDFLRSLRIVGEQLDQGITELHSTTDLGQVNNLINNIEATATNVQTYLDKLANLSKDEPLVKGIEIIYSSLQRQLTVAQQKQEELLGDQTVIGTSLGEQFAAAFSGPLQKVEAAWQSFTDRLINKLTAPGENIFYIKGQEILELESQINALTSQIRGLSPAELGQEQFKPLLTQLSLLSDRYAQAMTNFTQEQRVTVQQFKQIIEERKNANRYATGGYVSGSGTPTSDSIDAKLSRGEYVVNAQATAQNIGLLEAINQGKIPHFAQGGMVGVTPQAKSGQIGAAVSVNMVDAAGSEIGKAVQTTTENIVEQIENIAHVNHEQGEKINRDWERNLQQVDHQVERTADKIEQNLTQAVSHISHQSDRMTSDITQDVDQASGHFSRFANGLSGVFAGSWHTGAAVGGAVFALGGTLQTLAGSIGNLGTEMRIISDTQAQRLTRLTGIVGEVLTIAGAVGGILMPVLGIIGSGMGTILSLGTTTIAMVQGLGTAVASTLGIASTGIIPIAAGIVAVVAAVKLMSMAFQSNLFGIRTKLQAVGHSIYQALELPITVIEKAWEGFINRFGGRLNSIINPAKDVARQLINALNHNPTERIPEAWEGAVHDRIIPDLNHLAERGKETGAKMVTAVKEQLAWLFKAKEQASQATTATAIVPMEAELITEEQTQTWRDRLNSFMADTSREIEYYQHYLQRRNPVNGFNEILNDSATMATKSLNIYGQSLRTILGGMGKAIVDFDLGAMQTQLNAFAGETLYLFGGLGSALKNVALLLAAVATTGTIAFSPLTLMIGGAVIAGVALATNFLWIRTIIMQLGDTMLTAGSLIYQVINRIIKVIQLVPNLFTGMIEAVKGDSTLLIVTLSTMGQEIAMGFERISQTVVNFLGRSFDRFMSWTGITSNSITAFLSDTKGRLVNWFTEISADGEKAGRDFANALIQSWKQLPQQLNQLTQPLVKWISSWQTILTIEAKLLIERLGKNITQQIEQLKSTLKTKLDEFIDFLGKAPNPETMSNFFKDTFNQLTAIVLVQLDQLRSQAIKLLNIGDWFQDFGRGFSSVIMVEFNTTQAAIMDNLNQWQGRFVQWSQRMQGAIYDALAGGDLRQAVLNLTQRINQDLITQVSQFQNRLTGWLNNSWAELTQKATQGLDQLRGNIQALINNLYMRSEEGSILSKIAVAIQLIHDRLYGLHQGMEVFLIGRFSQLFQAEWEQAVNQGIMLFDKFSSYLTNFTDSLAQDQGVAKFLQMTIQGLTQLGQRAGDFAQRWQMLSNSLSGENALSKIFIKLNQGLNDFGDRLYGLSDRLQNIPFLNDLSSQLAIFSNEMIARIGQMTGAIEVIPTQVTGITAKIAGVTSELLQHITKSLRTLKAFWLKTQRYFARNDLFTGIQTQAQAIWGHFQYPIEKITTAWGTVEGKIKSIWDNLVSLALGVQNKLVTALNHDTTGKIKEAWTKAWVHIKEIFDKLTGAARQAGEYIANAFDQFRQSSPITTFTNIMGQLTEQINKAIANIKDIGNLATTFAAGFRSIYAPINELNEGMQENVTIGGKIINSFRNLGETINRVQDDVTGLLTQIKGNDQAMERITRLGENLAIALQKTGQFAQDSVPYLKGIAEVMITLGKVGWGIIESGFKAIHSILKLLIALGGGIKEFAQGIKSAFGGDTAGQTQLLAQNLETTGNSIERIVTQINQALLLVGKVLEAPFKGLQLLTDSLNGLYDNIVNIQNGLEKISNAGKAFGGELVDVQGKVQEKGFWRGIASRAADDINKLTGKTTTASQEISSNFDRTAQNVTGNIEQIADAAKAHSNTITGALSEASPGPTYWIRKNWAMTGDSVRREMDLIATTSKAIGQQLTHNLSENSPGPTSEIRANWGLTSRAVIKDIRAIEAVSVETANQMRTKYNMLAQEMLQAFKNPRLTDSMAVDLQGKMRDQLKEVRQIRRDQLRNIDSDVANARRGLHSSAQSFGNSIAGVLSNISPALATPFYLFNDFFDLFTDGIEFFKAFGNTTQASNAAITASNATVSASNVAVGATATGASTAQTVGATTAATTSTATGGIIASINGMLSASYATLGTVATATWAAITGPLLPLIGLVALVGVTIAGLVIAFKRNFGGLRNFVMSFVNAFRTFYKTLASGFKSVFVETVQVIFTEIGSIVKIIGEIGALLIEPFAPLLEMFGVSTGGGSSFAQGISNLARIVAKTILLPLRAIAFVLQGITKIMTNLIKVALIFVKPFAWLAGTLLKPIISAIMIMVRLIEGVGSLLMGIIRTLTNTLGGVLNSFAKLGHTIYQVTIEPIVKLVKVLGSLFNFTFGETSERIAAIEGIVKVLLFPLKIVAGTINLIITGIGALIKGIITLVTWAVKFNPVVLGFKLISGFVGLIFKGLGKIGNALKGLLFPMKTVQTVSKQTNAEVQAPIKTMDSGWQKFKNNVSDGIKDFWSSFTNFFKAKPKREKVVPKTVRAMVNQQQKTAVNQGYVTSDMVAKYGMAPIHWEADNQLRKIQELETIPSQYSIPSEEYMQMAVADRQRSNSTPAANFEFNFNGNVVLGDGAPQESAEEFLEYLEPMIIERMAEWMSDITERLR